MKGGLGEEGWGGALAFFCFLGPVAEAKAAARDPLVSFGFEVVFLPFCAVWFRVGAVVSDRGWRRGERRGCISRWEEASEGGTRAFDAAFWSASASFSCFSLMVPAGFPALFWFSWPSFGAV